MENITKSEAKIEAKLDGIKLYSGSFDLCDEVKQVNLTCPLSAKQYSISVKTKIPGEAPRVSTVQFITGGRAPNYCRDFNWVYCMLHF